MPVHPRGKPPQTTKGAAPPLQPPPRPVPQHGWGTCAARAAPARWGRGEDGASIRGSARSGRGAPRGCSAAAHAPTFASSSSSSSSPPQQQQLALLLMQPCGGGEAAAGTAGVALQPVSSADGPLPPSSSGGFMVLYGLGGPGGAEAREEEAEAEAAGGESTASLEELEEEEAEAGAAAASSGEAAAGGECKSCTYQGCSETTTQVVKQRKPWMCKRHRNKIYKDKYKRKKSDQALGGGGAAATAGGGSRAEDSVEGSVPVTKQRTGSIGDRPARPTLLEQVLNKKRLSLLRSPEVVQFLQKQQQLLSQQALEQRQQQFQGAPG
ncbi:regulatory factor X-associated protein [Chiroxiphia lanceolata]|uniref:regulatory factor X-associated protein n=1 Tax=Chiroxiphia lanceolata TaxID=296741 RepID=UPI0013CE8F5A|nr:regulatory factor X-associated protein [Chiroxiphia lanceolata]